MTAALAFPCLPQWFTAGRGDTLPSRMRPFGSAGEDLDVTFALAERPVVITEILARCCADKDGAPVDRNVWLQMPVGMRIEALLSLASVNDNSTYAWRVQCESAQCKGDEGNEFELTLQQILAVANEAHDAETTAIAVGRMQATVRRPTAADQLHWLQHQCATEPAAMLSSLVVQPTLDSLLDEVKQIEVLAEAVDATMDSFDPLLGFHVEVLCPRCGSSKQVWPDLTGAALERLAVAQRKAIEDVHLLASEYHWSEAQILALPAWRRQSYLDLVRAEAH